MPSAARTPPKRGTLATPTASSSLGRPTLPSNNNLNNISFRTREVFIRDVDEREAMSLDQRLQKRLASAWKAVARPRYRLDLGALQEEEEDKNDNNNNNMDSDDFEMGSDDDDDDDVDLEKGGKNKKQRSKKKKKEKKQVQYRLEAGKHSRKLYCASLQRALAIMTCGGYQALCCFWRGHHHSSSLSNLVGVHGNQRLAMSLHWMFRTNFLFLFVLMCIFFFIWVVFFTALLVIAGRMDPQCIRIGGSNDFNFVGTAFADAFNLSWTTFATVGYGATAPALGFHNDNRSHCFAVEFIASLEALCGILYSGFCGAILFGKVLRVSSHAQVLFSDPLLIRFGQDGVTGHYYDHDHDHHHDHHHEEGKEEDRADQKRPKIPCPVLEFRMVNRLHQQIGGEIMDAKLHVVANLDSDDSDEPAFVERSDSMTSDSRSEDGSDGGHSHEFDGHAHHSLRNIIAPLLHSLHGRQQNVHEEDPTTRLVSKQIFAKMSVEASDHPFFKRVWLVRHVLDETSPILRPRVRRMIRRQGGYWPNSLNHYDAIRHCLQFNQILVSLEGVSNASASSVYAQKIYDFEDVNIGYEFVSILFRDREGHLGVDAELINDVREQKGGGGEPLDVER